MPRRGKRKRLDRCIYQDATGRSVVVGGREYRRPADTSLADLRKLRNEREQERGTVTKGTLNAAIETWDGQESHLASYRERRAELRAWGHLYGPLRLTAITPAHLRRAIAQWTAEGIAPKTIRNRLWSLKHLYHVLNGARSQTPVDDISPPAKVRHVIAPVSPAVILAVYHKLRAFEQSGRLRDAKTRARYMVRAATGKRPSEIMRASPEDVDLARRIWRVRDGKGGWSEGLYLNDDMLAAWSVFIAADAWGEFNTGSMAEVLRAAGWPSERNEAGHYVSRPYHLRHTLGMEISERGIDLADVGGWLGHTDIQTTRRVYAPILNSRMQRISESLDGRLDGWRVPSPVPESTCEPLTDIDIQAENAGSSAGGNQAGK